MTTTTHFTYMLNIKYSFNIRFGGHSDISFGNIAIPVGILIFLKSFGKYLPPSSRLPKYIQEAVLKVFVKNVNHNVC